MPEEYERKILEDIEEYGRFCTSVVDPDQIQPSFSYSVGFTRTLNTPEFIVFGLSVKLMHSMLWRVFDDIKAGRRPEDGARWSGLLDGHDCIIRTVHQTNVVPDYFNSAIWFWDDAADRGALSAFQIVWPAVATDLFPWDETCPSIVRDAQPALYLPNAKLH